jgi:hypothetical protein
MKKMSQPVRLFIISLVIVGLLGACAVSTPTTVPSPTETEPTVSTGLELTGDGVPFIVYQGGYRFEVPLGSDVSITGPSTTISAEEDALLFKLDGLNKMSVTRSAQEILDILIETLFSADQSRVKKSEPITSTVEGNEGVAYDFTGTFLNHKVEGRALVVKPAEKRYISIIGMALVDDQPDLWQTTGRDIFNFLLSRYAILPEEHIASAEICPISPDVTYGYEVENAIKVGGGLTNGFLREKAYLDNLLGPDGSMVTYERVGSLESPDSIVDEYVLAVGTQVYRLYLDVYSYGVINAPRGLGCMGAFPLEAP